ncbi:MAG: class I adenylate-forming enzyme family protein, partial [Pseudomonadota bacterium]
MAWFSPDPLYLPRMLDLNADARASQDALWFEESRWTWSELVDACRRWAGALGALGLAPGDRVGVVMENSRETLVTLLGSLYGGFVAVPINTAVTEDAAIGMLNDSNAKVVVCNDRHSRRLESRIVSELELVARVSVEDNLGWQRFDDLMSAATPRSSAAPVKGNDECNIIYSSGTTGLPKGIVHDHRCRAAWAYDMAVALHYHPSANTLCTLGLYSNITWVAMLATVLAGGTLHVMRRFDVDFTFDYIAEHKISHTTMVPVQLQRMLQSDRLES